MQRQSLGSSTSDEDDCAGGETVTEVDTTMKSKTLKFTSMEKAIHLIPIIILICFLILYMVSNDPSPTDLLGLGQLYRKINSQLPVVQDIGMISNRRFKELVGANNGHRW